MQSPEPNTRVVWFFKLWLIVAALAQLAVWLWPVRGATPGALPRQARESSAPGEGAVFLAQMTLLGCLVAALAGAGYMTYRGFRTFTFGSLWTGAYASVACRVKSLRRVQFVDRPADRRVRFTYEVDGVKYEGSAVGLGRETSGRLGDLVEGDSASCYYRREQPGRAFIVAGRNWRDLLMGAGGAVLWVVLCLGAWEARKTAGRRSTRSRPT